MAERTKEELAERLSLTRKRLATHPTTSRIDLMRIDEAIARLREPEGERIEGRVFKGEKYWYFDRPPHTVRTNLWVPATLILRDPEEPNDG